MCEDVVMYMHNLSMQTRLFGKGATVYVQSHMATPSCRSTSGFRSGELTLCNLFFQQHSSGNHNKRRLRLENPALCGLDQGKVQKIMCHTVVSLMWPHPLLQKRGSSELILSQSFLHDQQIIGCGHRYQVQKASQLATQLHYTEAELLSAMTVSQNIASHFKTQVMMITFPPPPPRISELLSLYGHYTNIYFL